MIVSLFFFRIIVLLREKRSDVQANGGCKILDVWSNFESVRGPPFVGPPWITCQKITSDP